MNTTHTFADFPKMARLSRESIVTEKIDGTNAQVFIAETFSAHPREIDEYAIDCFYGDDQKSIFAIYAGSRNGYITPAKDNYGFAGWVSRNIPELKKLGVGRHFGEWWGNGIQRTYGMKEKVFSLFNTSRWGDDAIRPACCRVVPVIYQGIFTTDAVEKSLDILRERGSLASPGFMKPEGVVCFHVAANVGFKKTLEKDESPKSKLS